MPAEAAGMSASATCMALHSAPNVSDFSPRQQLSVKSQEPA
jgi:hypothetical protein